MEILGTLPGRDFADHLGVLGDGGGAAVEQIGRAHV